MREVKGGKRLPLFDTPLAHFGLGPYSTIDRVEIVWSTGERTVIDQPLPADARYVITRDADERVTDT